MFPKTPVKTPAKVTSCLSPIINRTPVQQVSKLPNCPSYLVDILRYTVHLVGPGHPCWSVSQNHRLKFPLGEVEMGEKETVSAGNRGLSAVTERDELA